jgi:hypothetical protein
VSEKPRTAEERLLLVYGPSGVGKTTAFRFADGRVGDVRLGSLDDMAAAFGRRKGLIGETQTALDLYLKLEADGFLEIGIQAADELLDASAPSPVVLDVGAGFLDAREAGRWLSGHKCIVFKASPTVAYARLRARDPLDPRTPRSYADQEFSRQRRECYALAHHAVDAGREARAVGYSFVKLILELANQAPTASSR